MILDNKTFEIIKNFHNEGKIFIKGNRNVIKLFQLNNITLNVKSFKQPNLLNSFIYKYFRKSKAKRSFEYANFLLKNNIGTPKPVAYYENTTFFRLKDSYYVCEHLENVFELRELVNILEFENRIEIIRQFTRFTYTLHQKGIEFLDHSPGNTLIEKKSDGKYNFYLVDLNRMKFHNEMNFQTRMKNLSKITPNEEMIALMSSEYAKLSKIDEVKVFSTMWKLTKDFQYRFYRKKRIKKTLKFWKK